MKRKRKFLKWWAPRYVFCITARKMSLHNTLATQRYTCGLKIKSLVTISGLKMTSSVAIWAGPEETFIEFLDKFISRRQKLSNQA